MDSGRKKDYTKQTSTTASSADSCNDGIGSLAHRHVCAVTAEARGKCTNDQECDRFISRLSEGARHLLQTRALLATLDLEGHRPNKEATFVWDLCPRDGVVDPGCTIYTDGSMVDGPTAEIGRVGFGFVAMDENGTITAKAFGTPPSWIDTVPGAEAWALHEAVRNMVPGCKIRSDCASVVNRMKKGRAAATSGKVKLARL